MTAPLENLPDHVADVLIEWAGIVLVKDVVAHVRAHEVREVGSQLLQAAIFSDALINARA